MAEKRRRWKRRGCVVLLVLPAALWLAYPGIIHAVGGAFDHGPEEMDEGLSDGARALLDRAFEGVDADRLLDYHVHVVGLGEGTDCWINPHLRAFHRLSHGVPNRIVYDVYLSASGITDEDRADAQYVERLAALIGHAPAHGRFLLLAFDHYYTADGRKDLERTQIHIPNDYVFEVAGKYPDIFVPAISVHPYRQDAAEELKRGRDHGTRIVKWLPNVQGIDPSSERCDAFYDAMRRLDMILLSHTGHERAIPGAVQDPGNPLRLRRTLDAGVTVVMAHCASLGEYELESGGTRASVDLFLELMDEKKYEGQLFGEISAITLESRVPDALRKVLARRDLHHRLVNGSDYPIPAININLRTGKLAEEGFITEEEREHLNEIYDYNPLLFDFAVKRTLRLPGTREGFPPSVFERHKKLKLR